MKRRDVIKKGIASLGIISLGACKNITDPNEQAGIINKHRKFYSNDQIKEIKARNKALWDKLKNDKEFRERFVQEVMEQGIKLPIEKGSCLWITGECIACDICVPECEQQAIFEGEIYYINANLCIWDGADSCDDCIQVCPVGCIDVLHYKPKGENYHDR